MRCGCTINSAAAAYLFLPGYISRLKIEAPSIRVLELLAHRVFTGKENREIASMKSASTILRIVFGLAVVAF
jgi:hypothetical protein